MDIYPDWDICSLYPKRPIVILCQLGYERIMELLMIQMARSAKQFGAAIQRHRTQKGWTQLELANRVGTGQKTISKIENGNPATKIETVFSLIAALDLELEIKSRSKTRSHENWEDLI